MNEKPEMPTSQKMAGSTAAADNQTANSDDDSTSRKDFDTRDYRPLDVVVSITMHDIQAHLMKVIIMTNQGDSQHHSFKVWLLKSIPKYWFQYCKIVLKFISAKLLWVQ